MVQSFFIEHSSCLGVWCFFHKNCVIFHKSNYIMHKVKAVRNASVRKIQIPPLSPVRPPIMERSEGNDSGTENNKTVLS